MRKSWLLSFWMAGHPEHRLFGFLPSKATLHVQRMQLGLYPLLCTFVEHSSPREHAANGNIHSCPEKSTCIHDTAFSMQFWWHAEIYGSYFSN